MNTTLNAVEAAKANNVVLNDKAINENKQKITDVLVQLEIERKEWESGAYKTSNKQLYAILSQCLAYSGTMDIASARQRSNQLEKFYEERKYRYKKDTPLVVLLILYLLYYTIFLLIR